MIIKKAVMNAGTWAKDTAYQTSVKLWKDWPAIFKSKGQIEEKQKEERQKTVLQLEQEWNNKLLGQKQEAYLREMREEREKDAQEWKNELLREKQEQEAKDKELKKLLIQNAIQSYHELYDDLSKLKNPNQDQETKQKIIEKWRPLFDSVEIIVTGNSRKEISNTHSPEQITQKVEQEMTEDHKYLTKYLNELLALSKKQDYLFSATEQETLNALKEWRKVYDYDY
jgi:hypothetical protein